MSAEESSGVDETLESSINDQITDGVAETDAAIETNDESLRTAISQQILVQAVSLAMQDAVAQQQRLNTLRNAVTAAAAKVVLDACPEALQTATEAAHAAMKIAESAQAEQGDIAATLERLRKLVDGAEGASTGER